jgi:hypothetical protein
MRCSGHGKDSPHLLGGKLAGDGFRARRPAHGFGNIKIAAVARARATMEPMIAPS